MYTLLQRCTRRLLVARPAAPASALWVRTMSRAQSSRPGPARVDQADYEFIDECEYLGMYSMGGFHPVLINDVLHNRFTIVDKLGYGGSSTVWVAKDNARKQEHLVALKLLISEPLRAHRESKVLRALSLAPTSESEGGAYDPNLLPRIFDELSIIGPNGSHPCYVMELMLGDLSTDGGGRLFPVKVARTLAARLVLAVHYVHSRGYVHGDIRPSNVSVRAPPEMSKLCVDAFRGRFGDAELQAVRRSDGRPLPQGLPSHMITPRGRLKRAEEFNKDDAKRLVLCDFGEAFQPASEHRVNKDCNIPQHMTAPEVFFEPDRALSYPSDIWSLGLTIWELLGQVNIFSHGGRPNETIAQQIDVLGLESFPVEWRELWERPETRQDDPHAGIPQRSTERSTPWPVLEMEFETHVQGPRRHCKPFAKPLGVFGEEEVHAILNLMRKMLVFRPECRLTTQQVLESEWFVKWALPELNG